MWEANFGIRLEGVKSGGACLPTPWGPSLVTPTHIQACCLLSRRLLSSSNGSPWGVNLTCLTHTEIPRAYSSMPRESRKT